MINMSGIEVVQNETDNNSPEERMNSESLYESCISEAKLQTPHSNTLIH